MRSDKLHSPNPGLRVGTRVESSRPSDTPHPPSDRYAPIQSRGDGITPLKDAGGLWNAPELGRHRPGQPDCPVSLSAIPLVGVAARHRPGIPANSSFTQLFQPSAQRRIDLVVTRVGMLGSAARPAPIARQRRPVQGGLASLFEGHRPVHFEASFQSFAPCPLWKRVASR